MFRNWFDRAFPSVGERALREIERRLQYVPWVRITAAAEGEPLEGTFYLVTAVNRKENRIAYFNPYSHANMQIDWRCFKSFSISPDQEYELLHNLEFNRYIWGVYKEGRNGNRQSRHRQRVGYTHDKYPIYIRKGLHVYEGTEGKRKLWGDHAPFEVAALEIDKGGPHIEAFSYYAGYGTVGFEVNFGPWEIDPRWIDYDQQARDKLHREYLEYKASPPFEEGDIIQSPGFQERIFIRYEDPDRTRMIVYPGKLIEGADAIARFVLLERKGVAVDPK